MSILEAVLVGLVATGFIVAIVVSAMALSVHRGQRNDAAQEAERAKSRTFYRNRRGW